MMRIIEFSAVTEISINKGFSTPCGFLPQWLVGLLRFNAKTGFATVQVEDAELRRLPKSAT